MKTLLIALALVTTPAAAQSNYYDNRFANPTPVVTQVVNQPNGYYYDKNKNVYYKPKSINRDLSGYTGQGSLGYTYDTNRYAPPNLSIR